MSKEDKEIEEPDMIVEIVEEILKFNKQKQEGQGIKILIPKQMLSRLPISLAQKIWELLYSLYRSKNMTKQKYTII